MLMYDPIMRVPLSLVDMLSVHMHLSPDHKNTPLAKWRRARVAHSEIHMVGCAGTTATQKKAHTCHQGHPYVIILTTI